jgi:hypothetical protein
MILISRELWNVWLKGACTVFFDTIKIFLTQNDKSKETGKIR